MVLLAWVAYNLSRPVQCSDFRSILHCIPRSCSHKGIDLDRKALMAEYIRKTLQEVVLSGLYYLLHPI